MTRDELESLAIATRDAAIARARGTATQRMYRHRERELLERIEELTRERDMAIDRACIAEEERDEARQQRDAHAARNRHATQQIIEAIGSVGPESVEDAVPRALARLAPTAERDVRRTSPHWRQRITGGSDE